MKFAASSAQEKPHYPHWGLAAALFILSFAFASGGARQASTWIDIRAGRLILETGVVPRTDPFSYGSARGGWTTDSWLSDVLFARADMLGGPELVRTMSSCAVAAGFALLLPINSGDPVAALGLLTFAAAAGWAGLGASPAAFDFLFFSLFLRLLRPRRRFRWTDGLAATALTALWANLHGASAPIALAFTFLKAFKASLRAALRESLGYWAIFCACALAFSWNPLGYGVLERLFADAPSWTAPLVSPAGLLIALGMGACVLTLQQEFVTTLSCAVVMALAVVVPALRPLGALAACPVCALALGYLPKSRLSMPMRMIFACAVAAWLFYDIATRAQTYGYGAPILDGVDNFLKVNNVTGAMFNEPALGAELIGRAVAPVFVDERPELYQQSFLAEARDWTRSFGALDSVYHFDYAIVANRRVNAPARVLDTDPHWRLAYADDRALVYVQRFGRNRALAAESPFHLVAPNRLWPDSVDESLQAATADAVLDELERWSALSPDSVQPILWRAYALAKRGRTQEADRALNRARSSLLGDPQLGAEAAFVLDVRGRNEEARELYRRAVRTARRSGDAALAAAIDARAPR